MAKRGTQTSKEQEGQHQKSEVPKSGTDSDRNQELDLGTGLPEADLPDVVEGLEPDAMPPPEAEGLGSLAGEALLGDSDPSAFDDGTAGLIDEATQSSGDDFDYLGTSDIEDPIDLDTDASFGLADGRTNAGGFEMGEEGEGPADPSEYVSDFGLGDAASLAGGALGFMSAAGQTAAFTLSAGSAGAVLGAAGAGYTAGTVINDNIVAPVVDATLEELDEPTEGEFGEGEVVENEEEKTNEPDEESLLLDDQDHGDEPDTDQGQSEGEPDNGQGQSEGEPDNGQGQSEGEPDNGQGQSEGEPDNGQGQSEGEPAYEAPVEDDPNPPIAEDSGPDSADPEAHAEWLARQDTSFIETYLAIEEAAIAGSEVNPVREGGDEDPTPSLPDQIDYGEGTTAPVHEAGLDELLEESPIGWEFDAGGE